MPLKAEVEQCCTENIALGCSALTPSLTRSLTRSLTPSLAAVARMSECVSASVRVRTHRWRDSFMIECGVSE
jgi:hypothetical protein